MTQAASRRKTALCTSVACTLIASAASAQVSEQIRSTIDPSKVEQRFDEPRRALPADAEPVAPSIPRSQPAVDAKKQQRFLLKSVAIEGATVYTQEQLQPLFADSLDKNITLGEAQALAEKVTLKYRNDGYILSQAVIPNQSVKNGQLQIRVIEGYISRVLIEGEVRDMRATPLVVSYGEKIKQQRPLHISHLERYLLLMDDLPGATAKGVVRPSPDTFGSADLVVTMSNKVWDGSLSVDNRGTRYIGRNQVTATLAENSQFNMYERTLLRGVTALPTDELKFVDLQHEQQIGTEGTRLLLSGSYSKTEPGYTLKSLDIEGTSKSLQARVQHPFIRSRTENLNGRVMFDYRNTDTDISGLDFSNDRLSVLRAGGGYDFADGWNGVNLIDGQVSQGINIFNATDNGIARSRSDGEADFTKFNLDLTRTHSLPGGFSILTAASGQYSVDRLLASEQFSVGGVGFGSAYDPAEISGDHGVAAKAELRYGRLLGYDWLNSYQAYTYYDIGKVWNRGGTFDNNSLASVGLGVRTNFVNWLSGSAEVGFPLTKEVAVENEKDPRFFFSVTGRF